MDHVHAVTAWVALHATLECQEGTFAAGIVILDSLSSIGLWLSLMTAQVDLRQGNCAL